MTPNSAELALLDRWQHDFPLVDRPFEIVGRSVSLDPEQTIRVFESMRQREMISRIGAVVRPNTVGASTLVALEVLRERLEEVADLVSREPLVTHNYEREHALNLWFVIAGADTTAVEATIRRIEGRTGLEAVALPLLQAYHLGLGFPLQTATARRGAYGRAVEYRPQALDRDILAAIEDGLPLVERPYRAVAEKLQRTEEDIVARLGHLIAAGVVTRFGCVVRHDKFGYRANAMAVWDIPDASVDAIARVFARHSGVTLCYCRPRHLPVWPYNIFCMVHARSRSDAFAVIDDLNLQADTGLASQAVLFSKRCFKQRGAVFSGTTGARP